MDIWDASRRAAPDLFVTLVRRQGASVVFRDRRGGTWEGTVVPDARIGPCGGQRPVIMPTYGPVGLKHVLHQQEERAVA